MPDIICAACGGDLTRGREFWDNASVLRPLLSVEVLPCPTCLTMAASEAVDKHYEGIKEIEDMLAGVEHKEGE